MHGFLRSFQRFRDGLGDDQAARAPSSVLRISKSVISKRELRDLDKDISPIKFGQWLGKSLCRVASKVLSEVFDVKT